MRFLLLGAAAVALSGCSFLGLGGHSKYDNYKANQGHHGTHHAKPYKQGCYNGQCLSRWNLEGGIGPEFIINGDAVVNERNSANSNINEISMDTAYDEGYRADLGVSYAFTPNTKATLTGHIAEADSAGVQNWGTLNGQQLTGALSDYKAKGVELGLRHYFAPRQGFIVETMRPYVEVRGGATHVDDINIVGAQRGNTALPNELAFYDSGFVASASSLVGVETPVGRYTTIALESGLRWTDDLKTNDSFVGGTDLAGTNRGGSRVTVPLMLRGRYRF